MQHTSFFEPRYKWLVKVACEEKGGLFVFCTAAPGAHERSAHYSWLCEAQNVHVLPDGRANLSVFPLGRCRLRRLWRENVPAAPDAPPLSFADVLEGRDGSGAGDVLVSGCSPEVAHPSQ